MRLLLKAFSLLPLRVLYAFSDLLFVILYLTGYRKRVVKGNLEASFPEKNDKEIKYITRLFYRSLCDIIVETIKAVSISEKQLLSRCRFADTEGFRHYKRNMSSAIILTGHFANWEWAGLAIGLITEKRPLQVVYMNIRNNFFNDFIKDLRTRLGNEAVKMERVYKNMLVQKEQGIVSCFLGDQTPQPHKAGYWGLFMNRVTPFFNGPEKLAIKLDQPVYFANIEKKGRGNYLIHMRLLTDKPRETAPEQIMSQYVNLMEQSIRKQPYNWLWSHRRWKYSYEKYGPKQKTVV